MRRARLAVIVALLCGALPARAATCAVSGVSLAFGGYDTLRPSHTDSIGTIAVTCSGTPGELVVYSIALSAGAGSYAQRAMRSASGTLLTYNIYANPARITVWGDGTQGSAVVSDSYRLSAPAVTRNYPTYGRIFRGQRPAVGPYVDSIVVTLGF